MQSSEKKEAMEIFVANSFNDMQMLTALRAMIFVGEQGVPYKDEFSTNEMCCTYIIGKINGEPAGLMRIHEFQGFAKFERMGVLQKYRKTGLADKIRDKGMEICSQKGIPQIYVLCRKELLPHWELKGFRRVQGGEAVEQNGMSLLPMTINVPKHPTPINIHTSPNILNQQEGEWKDDFKDKFLLTKIKTRLGGQYE